MVKNKKAITERSNLYYGSNQTKLVQTQPIAASARHVYGHDQRDVTAFAEETVDTSAAVTINDENLRKAICSAIGKEYSEGVTVTENEMASLTDLTGLEKAVNLEILDLSGNDLSSQNVFTFLYGMGEVIWEQLRALDLSKCNIGGENGRIMDTGWGLNNFPSIESIDISDNNLSGVAILGSDGYTLTPFCLSKLKTVDFSNNNFTAFSV